MYMPRAILVGAGVAGLSAAILLAAHGWDVRVLERGSGPGGKARAATVGGTQVDAGPTVLTMPWVFDELFEATGAAFRSAVGLSRMDTIARHAWVDGTRLDLHADRRASAEAVGYAFGSREARAFLDFADDARRIFETVREPFLRSQRPTLSDVARRAGHLGLSAITRIDGLRTMWRSLEKRFDDPRLRQLFGRYATYCGSSPFEAPATLNLIAHVEAEGVYRVHGGMRALAVALEARARRLGVAFSYDTHVERILVEGGRARGVRAGAEELVADVVVFNGDVSALGAGLLGPGARRAARATRPAARSLSAVTWTVLGRANGFPLAHHNVFFARDYGAEFEAIFGGRVPAEPTVYVCAQDRDDGRPPEADERLLVLINAPATGDAPALWGESVRHECERSAKSVLAACGLKLETTASLVTTPADFHALYPATGGALYGPRARGSTSAFSREAAASKIPGLYLVGGSVHPGPGVPMAALSGRLAVERILADRASTSRSRTAATAGTTSTV
jgi:1-hydroxycarotenoid 3,4-desaturase